jgi:hypothetical protein
VGGRWARILLLAVLLLGSGCQAVARVTVKAGPAGDGTVAVTLTIDREASALVGDLTHQLKIADLRRAGWKVAFAPPALDGAQTVTLTKPFRDSAGAVTLFVQLTGPTGPLRGLRLQRHRTFSTTRTALTGTVDLKAGVDAFADPTLAAQLGVTTLSAPLARLRQSGAADAGLHVQVAAILPGGVSAARGAVVTHGTAVWTVPLGQSVLVDASARQRNWLNLILAGVCVASLFGLAVIGISRTIGPRLGAGLGHRRDRWDAPGGGLAGLRGRRGRVGRGSGRHHRRRDTWRTAERRGQVR